MLPALALLSGPGALGLSAFGLLVTIMASANLLSMTGLIATISSSVAGLFAFKLTKELSRRGVDRKKVVDTAKSTAVSTARLTVRCAITVGIAVAYAVASLVSGEPPHAASREPPHAASRSAPRRVPSSKPRCAPMRAQVSLLVWLLTRLGESLLLVAELTSRLKPVAEGASPRYLPPPYEAPETTLAYVPPAYAPPAPAPASPRFAYNFGGRGVSSAAAAPSPAIALAPAEEMDPREVGRQLAVEQMLKRSSAAAAASRKVEQAKSEMLQARQEEALRKVFEDKRKDQIGNARSSSAVASQPLSTALKARVLSASSGTPVSARPLPNRSPSSLSPDLKAALRSNATDAAPPSSYFSFRPGNRTPPKAGRVPPPPPAPSSPSSPSSLRMASLPRPNSLAAAAAAAKVGTKATVGTVGTVGTKANVGTVAAPPSPPSARHDVSLADRMRRPDNGAAAPTPAAPSSPPPRGLSSPPAAAAAPPPAAPPAVPPPAVPAAARQAPPSSPEMPKTVGEAKQSIGIGSSSRGGGSVSANQWLPRGIKLSSNSPPPPPPASK